MFLETTITTQLQQFPFENSYLYESDNPNNALKIVERLLYGSVPLNEKRYHIQQFNLKHDEGCIALEVFDWLEEQQIHSYQITGLILESELFTKDYLNVMSVDEVKAILSVLYRLPDDAIQDVFHYCTFRKPKGTTSLYNNKKPYKHEQYRISDHWNIWIDGKLAAPTTEKKKIVNSFCLGKKVGNKWEIQKEYGGKVTRSQESKQQIINQLLDSRLFAGNKQVIEFLEGI